MNTIFKIKNIFLSHWRGKTKLAIVVRSDVRMTKGKTAAQCAHAAVLCFQEAQKADKVNEVLKDWCNSGQPKIILRVDSYSDLENLQNRAINSGIVTALVRDAGRTQLEPGTATVLGIGPGLNDDVNKIVSHLKLL